MNQVMTLLNLACGQNLPVDEDTRPRRLELAVGGLLMALAFSAVWGAAVGSVSLGLALGNLVKVPLVLLLSTLAAAPAGMLAWKLSGSTIPGSKVLSSLSASICSAGMVLAVTAPVVALYYQTSAWAGPLLGGGSVLAAITVAVIGFTKGMLAQDRSPTRVATGIVVGVFLAVQMATLLQLAALLSPIMPDVTLFSGGIDRLLMH